MKKLVPLIISLLGYFSFQAATLSGKVIDIESRFGVEFAAVKLIGTDDVVLSIYTDLDGNFKFEDLTPGLYNLSVSAIGYKVENLYELKVTNNKPVELTIELKEDVIGMDTVIIGDNRPLNTQIDEESPVSKYTIGAEDVERNPGAGRDVSRVIRSLPGVASTPSFRNDIIIRGGAPNENRFYLDGIEIPNINHFATQGASGGPVGLINVNFVNKVDFFSSAFPANRGNALSSVISFDFKDGRTDKFGYRATVGSSDFGLTVDGPLSKNATIIASVRRSYLQFLFKAIGLPFLPTYNDYQFKIKIKPNENSELTILGIGALDQFRLNESVNDGVDDPLTLRRNEFILGNLPINEQWNYTQGIKYVRYSKKSAKTFVLSRNMLNNSAFKFEDNDESQEQLLDYNSQEIENKFRFEQLIYNDFADITYSLETEYVKTNTQNRSFRNVNGRPVRIVYDTDISFFKFGGSIQSNKTILNNKLVLSAGIRMDGNSYSATMANPLQQFSPRLAASYRLTDQLSINANVGIYHQLPAYTILSFRDQMGELANRENEVTYITNNHYVLGTKYFTKWDATFSLEGFYKRYRNYPFLVNDGLSLANLGSDFGVIGNDAVTSTSFGRTYGGEFLYQQKMRKGFFGLVAYTFVISQFSDQNGDLKPSAWDSRNIVNLTFGKKFKKNWQVGAKFRYSGGLPYTPFDIPNSSLVQNWDVFGAGTPDINRLNSERTRAFHGLDIRVDKEYFFEKWSINFYLDIENIYSFVADVPPTLLLQQDENGNPIIVDASLPANEQRYATELINTGNGRALPTIGIIVDF